VSWGWLEVAAEEVPAGEAWLSEAELRVLGPAATPPRRADWRLGRWTAKRAVAAWLGLPQDLERWSALAILPDRDGAPVPRYRERPIGLSLSLSHRAGHALAVVGAAGVEVGCDLERIEPRSAAFVADYLTRAERAHWAASRSDERDALANRVWSAKESVLKLARRGLRVDPREVEVRFAIDGRTAGWRPLSARWAPLGECGGWWRQQDDRILTLVARPAQAPPRSLGAALAPA
jgi:4'-phosphopantetheinyl transferase